MAKADHDSFKIRCINCRTLNRIPSEKAKLPAKCGRCGKSLQMDEIFLPQPMMISDRDFDTRVLGSPLPVLAYFWAPWCPTCKTTSPIIDEFASLSRGRIRVVKVNVDTSPQSASKYDVMSVPSLLIFDNGALQETITGALEKHSIMMKMGHYL
ncbi:MAG: thioredoxin domain-containing protein [Thermodesulfobacteriota bacterium]